MSINKIEYSKKWNTEKENLETVQKKIQITEENLDAYKEFVRLTKPRRLETPLSGKREEISLYLLILVSIFIPLCIPIIVATIFPTVGGIIGILIMASVIPFALMNFYISDRIIRKMNMRTFQKQYPDFDITIDTNEAKKELEKYRELSKVPKKIEEKKEEHLLNFQNTFKEMSTEEKIKFLNQEREFWEQMAIQEKYGNSEEQQEKQFVKKQNNETN